MLQSPTSRKQNIFHEKVEKKEISVSHSYLFLSFFFHRFSSVCSCATNIIIIISRKTKKIRNVIGDSVSISMCKLYLTSLICIFSGKNSGFDPSSNDTMADLANSTPSYIIQVCKQFLSPKKNQIIAQCFTNKSLNLLTPTRR